MLYHLITMHEYRTSIGYKIMRTFAIPEARVFVPENGAPYVIWTQGGWQRDMALVQFLTEEKRTVLVHPETTNVVWRMPDWMAEDGDRLGKLKAHPGDVLLSSFITISDRGIQNGVDLLFPLTSYDADPTKWAFGEKKHNWSKP